MKCRTEKEYPSLPYRILTTSTVAGNTVMVRFHGIDGSNAVFLAFDYARAQIEFPGLSPGNYNLMFLVSSYPITGRMEVTESGWEIILSPNNWIILPRSKLHRMPNNVIWGRAEYTSESNRPIIDAFYDSLGTCGASAGSWAIGDYGQFTINTDGNIGPLHTDPGVGFGGRRFNEWFIRQYMEAPETLRDLIKQIGEAHGDSVSVSLNLSDGTCYASHLHEIYPGSW
ncbi:hypothetical protein ACFL41_00420 [Gemmatimonadota bacterium]